MQGLCTAQYVKEEHIFALYENISKIIRVCEDAKLPRWKQL